MSSPEVQIMRITLLLQVLASMIRRGEVQHRLQRRMLFRIK